MSSKSKSGTRGAFGTAGNVGRMNCYHCRRPGKPTEKHFPIQVYQKVRRPAVEGTTTEKELKISTKPVLVGYLCRVCAKKELRRDAARKSSKADAVVNTIKSYK